MQKQKPEEASMKRMHHLPAYGIFVFLLVLSLLPPNRSEAASSSGRKFYLTKDIFTGAQALTACAKGYHMASFWEIFDVSNLKYNTILGLKGEDSGSGPPSGGPGWIRTGSHSSVISLPGTANCNVWSSDSSLDHGTVVALETNWLIQSDDRVNPWISIARPCDNPSPVWCVQN
jgi:hypothetical protein